MLTSKRLTFWITFFVALVCSYSGHADSFPDRPVTLIIPFSAGGSHDLNARVITSVIPTYLGQPMLVKLMPGGSGQRGVSATIEAEADGYTLLFGHNFIDQLQPLVVNLDHDPMEALTVVWKLNESVPVMYVNAESAFKSVEDVIRRAKENPGDVVFGNSGRWGASFTVGTMLAVHEQLYLRYVPYKGGGPVKSAILAGDVDFSFAPLSSVLELQRNGKVRILASVSQERLPAIPEVPSFAELGIPFQGTAMERIVMAPVDTPPDRIQKLADAFARLYEDKSFVRLMKQLGEDTSFMSGSDYEKVRQSQRETYGELVRKLTTKD